LLRAKREFLERAISSDCFYKNIAPSKYRWSLEERGDATRASPSLVAWFSLDNSLGCHGHAQA